MVFNYILLATDSGDCIFLLIFILTAASDTFEDKILNTQNSEWEFGQHYLSYSSSCVSLGSFVSFLAPGRVPQGSIVGPSYFVSLYFLPLGSILMQIWHLVTILCR